MGAIGNRRPQAVRISSKCSAGASIDTCHIDRCSAPKISSAHSSPCWVAGGTGCSDDDEELDDEESVSPESDASLGSKRSMVSNEIESTSMHRQGHLWQTFAIGSWVLPWDADHPSQWS